MKMDEIYSLMNGFDSLFGTGEGWIKAKDFMDESVKNGTIDALTEIAIVFLSKPRSILITGCNSKGKQITEKMIDPKLATFLPSLSDEQLLEMGKSRDNFGSFSKVNFTMVRRVAILALDNMLFAGKVKQSWLDHFGNTPSNLDLNSDVVLNMKGGAKTVEIFSSVIMDYRKYKHLLSF